jgi:hypothetical protein
MKPSSIWNYFGNHFDFDGSLRNVSKATRFSTIPQSGPLTPLRRPLVDHTGLIWDLALDANDPSTTSAVQTIITEVLDLGFNLIQLRLSDDMTFAYQSKVQPAAKHLPPNEPRIRPIIEADTLKDWVDIFAQFVSTAVPAVVISIVHTSS